MTATGADSAVGELRFERYLNAPRRLAFQCLTTPAHLAHFWGPVGTRTPIENITVDLRPGGVFETRMVNESDGSEYRMRAVYAEVVEPERLVWIEADSGMVTTVTFTEVGPSTTRVLIHETNVPAAYLTAENRAGQESSHRRMEVYLSTLTGV
jgi:uncharacterized protein YndB with AHSA1/START domain